MAATQELEPQKQTPVEERLTEIRAIEDPTVQYRRLINNFNEFPDVQSMGDVQALLDFAADPEASESLLVRAQAFEVALEKMDNMSMRKKYGLLGPEDPEIKDLNEEFSSIVNPSVWARANLIKNPINDGEGDPYAWSVRQRVALSREAGDYNPYQYRGMIAKLARKEGVADDAIFHNWDDENPDYKYVYEDPMPAHAILVLEGMADRISQYDRSEQTLAKSSLVKMLPLAIDIQKALNEEDGPEFVDTEDVEEISRDAEEAGQLWGRQEAEKYKDIMNELEDKSRVLSSLFPERYSESVKRGAQAMIADCVYALNQHLKNGSHTETKLPLNGNLENGLPFKLEGDEPLEIIESLIEVFDALDGVGLPSEGSSVSTTEATKGKGFKMYRLWRDGDPEHKSQVTVYIRPRGAETYADDVEYGRNGLGVEPAISYVVDPTVKHGEVSEIGKHRGPKMDNRVGVRLDREGVDPDSWGKPGAERMPTSRSGTLALDIGSIIGNPKRRTTRIARFLAWGNHLRAQALSEDTHLNHSVAYFSPEDSGIKNFALAAKELSEYFESRKLSKEEIVARFSGVAATRASHKRK